MHVSTLGITDWALHLLCWQLSQHHRITIHVWRYFYLCSCSCTSCILAGFGSWKAAYLMEQVTRVSIEYLTSEHECFKFLVLWLQTCHVKILDFYFQGWASNTCIVISTFRHRNVIKDEEILRGLTWFASHIIRVVNTPAYSGFYINVVSTLLQLVGSA